MIVRLDSECWGSDTSIQWSAVMPLLYHDDAVVEADGGDFGLCDGRATGSVATKIPSVHPVHQVLGDLDEAPTTP
jgi:hypothetical protein